MLLSTIRLFILAIILMSSSIAAEVKGSITFLKGRAFVVRGMRTLPAKVGTELRAGDIVAVEDASQVSLQLANTGLLKITEKTKFEIPAQEAQKERTSSISLFFGGIWTEAKKLLQGESFEIKTPTATAGVRGTRFGTTFNPASNSMSALVEEGHVQAFTPDGNSVDLFAGMVGQTSGGGISSRVDPVAVSRTALRAAVVQNDQSKEAAQKAIAKAKAKQKKLRQEAKKAAAKAKAEAARAKAAAAKKAAAKKAEAEAKKAEAQTKKKEALEARSEEAKAKAEAEAQAAEEEAAQAEAEAAAEERAAAEAAEAAEEKAQTLEQEVEQAIEESNQMVEEVAQDAGVSAASIPAEPEAVKEEAAEEKAVEEENTEEETVEETARPEEENTEEETARPEEAIEEAVEDVVETADTASNEQQDQQQELDSLQELERLEQQIEDQVEIKEEEIKAQEEQQKQEEAEDNTEAIEAVLETMQSRLSQLEQIKSEIESLLNDESLSTEERYSRIQQRKQAAQQIRNEAESKFDDELDELENLGASSEIINQVQDFAPQFISQFTQTIQQIQLTVPVEVVLDPSQLVEAQGKLRIPIRARGEVLHVEMKPEEAASHRRVREIIEHELMTQEIRQRETQVRQRELERLRKLEERRAREGSEAPATATRDGDGVFLPIRIE